MRSQLWISWRCNFLWQYKTSKYSISAITFANVGFKLTPAFCWQRNSLRLGEKGDCWSSAHKTNWLFETCSLLLFIEMKLTKEFRAALEGPQWQASYRQTPAFLPQLTFLWKDKAHLMFWITKLILRSFQKQYFLAWLFSFQDTAGWVFFLFACLF